MQDRGVEPGGSRDRAGPREQPLAARAAAAVRQQRRRTLGRSDPHAQFGAVGLQQLFDLPRDAAREDQGAQAQACGLQRAVEGAAAGLAQPLVVGVAGVGRA